MIKKVLLFLKILCTLGMFITLCCDNSLAWYVFFGIWLIVYLLDKFEIVEGFVNLFKGCSNDDKSEKDLHKNL